MTDVQYESIIRFLGLAWGSLAAFYAGWTKGINAWRDVEKSKHAASIQIAKERSEGDTMMRDHEDRMVDIEKEIRTLAKLQRDQLIEVLGELRK